MTTTRTEPQHTPTPWAVSAMGTGNIIGGPDRRLVANCAGHQNNFEAERVAIENDANADLIVRAVNSHAALVEALDYINAVIGGEEATPDPDELIELVITGKALIDLRAALAAARGTK